VQENGVQFALFSRNGRSVTLCLFAAEEDGSPFLEISLDPRQNRTGDIWHAYVEGLSPGSLYLYRVSGPFEPEKGHRFDPEKLLIDPYAKALAGSCGYAAALPSIRRRISSRVVSRRRYTASKKQRRQRCIYVTGPLFRRLYLLAAACR
jgi:pullulanase/glycogen debranching enzyme